MKTISASDANRYFSSLLRDVVAGETVTVLSHGKPVAKILPAYPDDQEREAARLRLLSRLRRQIPTALPQSWNRNDLYEH
jgi:prevent-host-death family protein